jgi:divinyl protochlorophyllide a 8-vinyl-reductase
MNAAAATATQHAGRIGPNAITRLAEVLPSFVGAAMTRHLFDSAGLLRYLSAPPQEMVDEAEVRRLHAVLHETLGGETAGRIAHRAGLRTADYLMAHRIPKAVQALLRCAPAPLAARMLLAAIRRHAWTFSGSGDFTASAGQPVLLAIRGNPLCQGFEAEAPACAFYAATFERLFRALVHPDASVREIACEACGADACRFEVRW